MIGLIVIELFYIEHSKNGFFERQSPENIEYFGGVIMVPILLQRSKSLLSVKVNFNVLVALA